MLDAEKDIEFYLDDNENKPYKLTVQKTKEFLSGYYSSYALELLSSIDYIKKNKNVNSVDEISKYLESWSNRKKTLFNNSKYVIQAIQKIKTQLN